MSLLKIFFLSFLVILPFIVLIIIKQRKKSVLRKKVLAEGIDDYKVVAKNITNSISKSRKLYKELIVKIHPDKFQNDKRFIATELTARITKAKRNYEELTLLQLEVYKFLKENKDD